MAIASLLRHCLQSSDFLYVENLRSLDKNNYDIYAMFLPRDVILEKLFCSPEAPTSDGLGLTSASG
jgi:hypothetical protein